MIRRMTTWATAFLFGLACMPLWGQAEACEGPPYDDLDFWLGEWIVESDGVRQGTNRISRILDGCAVREEWQASGGGRGESLFYVNAAGEWRQVWVTERATRIGGVKEKARVDPDAEDVPPGAVRFQGTLPLPEGGTLLDRTTLTPLDDGSVRQHIEVSRDAGANWQTTFDARYVRADGTANSPASSSLGIVRAMLEAFNAHDADALAALVTPDFEYRFVGKNGETEMATAGREDFRDRMAAYFDEFPEVESRLVAAIDGTARVAFRERVEGGESSIAVYEIRDGLVHRAWYYPSEPWPDR